MKNFFLLTLAALSGATANAQNKAVVTQHGNGHDVSVVQHGSGNTSVINQSNTSGGNQATVTQSGSDNVVTINQGDSSASAGSQNSVSATQSGEGETNIIQTKDGSSIRVYQGPGIRPDTDKKRNKNAHRKE